MNWLIAGLAAATGYLIGSISFARIVTRLFAPQQDISRVEIAVPGTEIVLRSDAVSATTVQLHLGRRYGCLVGVLDILKAALPALAFKVWYPETPYYLIAAGMAAVGHNWPVYHRFKGGRGLSPITGGMLVLDWLGVLVTNAAGVLIGLALKDTFLATGVYLFLMIPWIWFRSHDWVELAYVVSMAALYWISLLPEVKEDLRLRREGNLEQYATAEKLQIRTRVDGRMVDRDPLVSLIVRIVSRIRHDGGTPDEPAAPQDE
jgi:acyl phosphate:glycerol-3-phosphate acyltransferase